MAEEIINRVSKSPLLTIDMDDYINRSEQASFDLKDGLFQGVLLREKEFRAFIKAYDWDQYHQKNVAVYCSTDAIIPTWAYMLVATKLHGVARLMILGDEVELEKALIDQGIDEILKQDLKEAKVVIKGCGDIKSRDYAYFQLTNRLLSSVNSIMYGEPCSTVPVFKRKKV